MDTQGRSAVLLAHSEEWRPADIAKALAAHRGIPYLDAVKDTKPMWGIVAEAVEEGEANALIAALSAAGIESFAVPAGAVVPLPEPVELRAAAFDANGFAAAPQKRHPTDAEFPKPRAYPWRRLAVIAGAVYKKTTRHVTTEKQGPSMTEKAAKIGIMMATGLPLPSRKTQEVTKVVQDVEQEAVLDLVFRDPIERLRINAARFDFAALGERRALNALSNYRIFLSDLAAMAPGAVQSRGTQIMVLNEPLNRMGYETPEDADRELRWLTTLALRSG